MFTFVENFTLHNGKAVDVPRCKVSLYKYFNYLSINELRHDVIFRLLSWSALRIVKYSDDSGVALNGIWNNSH